MRSRGRRRLAAWLLGIGLATGYLGSTNLVGDLLIAPLETHYPPLRDSEIPGGVRYVVVLGSGYFPHDDIPVSAALSDDGLVRSVEGIRIARRIPQSTLILSGGAPPGFPPAALGYRLLALDLGVPPQSIVLLEHPRDTAEEAKAIVSHLARTPFIVVTSAYHMPRAMRLLKDAGAQAIAAPTGQRFAKRAGWGWRSLLPCASGLSKSEYALHELLGLLALQLSGR